MIQVKTFQFNMLQENTYVVSDDTREAVVIDCGAFYDAERRAIVAYLRDEGLTLRHVLLTHGHLDHCFGCDVLADEFGVNPTVHAGDDFLVADLTKQAADVFGMPYDRPTQPIARYIADGDSISFGHHRLSVIHTPGHSPGCVVYYCAEEQLAFTGDTLFRMSVGRTDFERGSWQDLMQSLALLAEKLPASTTICPGHGPRTTMHDELLMNPYFRK